MAAQAQASPLVIDKARRLIHDGRLQQVTPDETWLVRAESDHIYAVMIWLREANGMGQRAVAVRCTCQAGAHDVACHHALAVLAERS